MYLPSAGVGSTGVTPVVLGVESHFKPWYFTGRIVYWGKLYPTRTRALEAAALLAVRHSQP
jgi:hypothetical protein